MVLERATKLVGRRGRRHEYRAASQRRHFGVIGKKPDSALELAKVRNPQEARLARSTQMICRDLYGFSVVGNF